MRWVWCFWFLVAVGLGCSESPRSPTVGVQEGRGSLSLWDLDVSEIRPQPGTHLVTIGWEIKAQGSFSLPRKVVFSLECLDSSGKVVVTDLTTAILDPGKEQKIKASFEVAKELAVCISGYRVSAQTVGF